LPYPLEQRRDPGMVSRARHIERRFPFLRFRLRIGLVRQQETDQVLIAARRRRVQRRIQTGLFGVDLGVVRQQQRADLPVPAGRRGGKASWKAAITPSGFLRAQVLQKSKANRIVKGSPARCGASRRRCASSRLARGQSIRWGRGETGTGLRLARLVAVKLDGHQSWSRPVKPASQPLGNDSSSQAQ
jgi:hypothetical protein